MNYAKMHSNAAQGERREQHHSNVRKAQYEKNLDSTKRRGKLSDEVIQPIAEDRVSIESERAVSALFARRRLPRSYHWLYRRSDDFSQAHMPSVLDKLCDDGTISALGDGTWKLADAPKEPIDESAEMSGGTTAPEWEVALAEYLEREGVPIQRRRMECGYTLALAMTAFAARLDVEIDGRQHQLLPSQRAKDVARDQRLKASGWAVLRLNVADVVASPSACGEKVIEVWKKVKDGGSIE